MDRFTTRNGGHHDTDAHRFLSLTGPSQIEIVSVNANTFRSNIIHPKLSKSVIVVDIALKAGSKHCESGTAHISASELRKSYVDCAHRVVIVMSRLRYP